MLKRKRGRHTWETVWERESFHVAWSGMKPGSRSHTLLSHTEAEDQVLGFFHCFQRHISRKWMENGTMRTWTCDHVERWSVCNNVPPCSTALIPIFFFRLVKSFNCTALSLSLLVWSSTTISERLAMTILQFLKDKNIPNLWNNIGTWGHVQ